MMILYYQILPARSLRTHFTKANAKRMSDFTIIQQMMTKFDALFLNKLSRCFCKYSALLSCHDWCILVLIVVDKRF